MRDWTLAKYNGDFPGETLHPKNKIRPANLVERVDFFVITQLRAGIYSGISDIYPAGVMIIDA
jgi:hypothetical protein